MVSAVARKLPSFGGSRLWLPVHDELVVECAEGDAEDVAAMMGETMRVQVGDVPVGGKPAVLGRRWLHA
jgi:DNA polymerase I-like protein with 3'-5' exonuclease and polymerase domains